MRADQIILQVSESREVTNRYLWGPSVDEFLADEQLPSPSGRGAGGEGGQQLPSPAGGRGVGGEGGGHSQPGEILWPLTDHLNTVRDLAQYNPETGQTTIANHLTYDAFGQILTQTNPAVTTLFAFTARPFDPDTSLQNNLHRWYDASVGRWLSEDAIGFAAADSSLYRYVYNTPGVHVDPSGLDGDGESFWKRLGASTLPGWAEFANGLSDFAGHTHNLGVAAVNTAMAAANEVAMMSNCGRPIFDEPLPYVEVHDWSRDIAAPQPEWVHQFNMQASEFLGGLVAGEALGRLGAAAGGTTSSVSTTSSVRAPSVRLGNFGGEGACPAPFPGAGRGAASADWLYGDEIRQIAEAASNAPPAERARLLRELQELFEGWAANGGPHPN